MDSITLDAEVGGDHRLIEPLPPEVPIGRVTLVILPVQEPSAASKPHLTRVEARHRWTIAGKSLMQPFLPLGVLRSSPEEQLRLARLLGQGASSEQIIDEDRGPHE